MRRRVRLVKDEPSEIVLLFYGNALHCHYYFNGQKEEFMIDEIRKVELLESELPKEWYNIQADVNVPPHISGQTMKVATHDELAAIFPDEIIRQEYSKERYISIPDDVLDIYRTYRATPLHRARGLERRLGTPAKIFYKYEGNNATGSHKLNSAVPQVFYNKAAGITRIVTETGAGQWGSALSMACNHFGLECVVYMVRVSYDQKPYRRTFMQTFGSQVIASPSELTEMGKMLRKSPNNIDGSLGMAISEAVEDAVSRADTNYALGSVLNHVCMHQTIIGLEAKKQFEKINIYPDTVIACAGGGSNFAGIAFPFIKDKLDGKSKTKFIAAESSACPSLTQGVYAYDYGDTGHIGPITKMYTLGSTFVPSGVHAGGLRYHGMNPIVSKLYHDKIIEAKAYDQLDTLKAGVFFAQSEGIIPAPESSHSVKCAIDEALKAKESGEEKVILFGLSGNGYFDMTAYERLLKNEIRDSKVVFDKKKIELPKVLID